jgi:ubiquinone/menaquinone biosynthesis C-methylase UbiE
MSIDSTLVDYYAQRAGEYERIYHKPERQEDLQRLKELVRSALAGRDVLEVACGTGYWTEIAATTANSITAFDVNDSVLEIARSKAIDSRKVHFAIGDAYALPPLSRRFDAALVAFWWSHVPKEKLSAFLHELTRALLPGAVVVFVDNVFVPGNSTPLGRRDAHGNTYQMRQLDNGQSYEVLKNYPDQGELQPALRGSAEQIEVKWLTYYWHLSCRMKG